MPFLNSLRTQPISYDTTCSFPANQLVKDERRNYILMISHCPDLGSVFDWWKQVFLVAQPVRGAIQNWIVTHNQYGISILCLFLAHHFGGKKVLASQIGGCFIGLCFLAVTIIKL